MLPGSTLFSFRVDLFTFRVDPLFLCAGKQTEGSLKSSRPCQNGGIVNISSPFKINFVTNEKEREKGSLSHKRLIMTMSARVLPACGIY